MDNSLTRYLFTSAHLGSYFSIKPIANKLSSDQVFYALEGPAASEHSRNGLLYWDLEVIRDKWGSVEKFLIHIGVRAVVRGTSEVDSDHGIENMVAQAATNLNIPIFVIEDFPGNYWHNPRHDLDTLFIEDESVNNLHQIRGVDASRIFALGNPRYERYYDIDKIKKRKETRMSLNLDNDRVLLWTGQPDGVNSYIAFERLVTNYEDPRLTILFRAHSRDINYSNGLYQELFRSCPYLVKDVSDHNDIEGLYCAADLVATQFSSTAVEASHCGTPGLFVLFADLGQEYLRTNKGYSFPLWCIQSCSFLIKEELDIANVLREALWNETSREIVKGNFQRHFGEVYHNEFSVSEGIKELIHKNTERFVS